MSDYLSKIFKDTPEAVAAGGVLVPEEQELADALIKITDKYGKFNADNTGVWAGYTSAAENIETAKIGVKCGNCIFFNAPNGCSIITAEVEEGGLCRFAVLPDGAVMPEPMSIPSEDVEFSNDSPCWDGYKQVGMKNKNGKMVPNCVPDDEASMTATAGTKPASKKDQIKGSDKNKEGSASTGKGVEFTASITKALENKVSEHNEKAKDGRKVTLRMLKAVYRRGAGAFSSSHRPDQNRNSWSMARVNAFLKLVRSGKPSNSKYTQDNDLLPEKHPRSSEASNMSPLFASMFFALDEESCPPATQDIVLNIENRQNAIDNVGYGPLNPDEANTEFWQDKADRWKITPVEASKSICGNCVFFDRRPKTLDCIETGIASGGSGDESAWSAIDQAELGYCTALDFKCAASRTCNAWAAGGPIVEEEEQAEVASGGPGVSAPILKEGDIKAPVNGKKLRLPMRNEIALRKKVLSYNTKNPQTPFTASVDMVKAVYRRGAGAYNGGEFSSQTRDDWSMNRVDAFLSLLASGQPANSAYTQDFDLLPLEHPKSTRGTASLTASAASDYSYELAVELMNEDDYESQEHAIHVLAEFSGLGYDVIPAIRAAWLRGLKNEENPYERAAILATALYSSPDADLLPKKGTL